MGVELLPSTDHETQLVPPSPQPLPPWNVVLLDDNDHTYAYVIEMLHYLFGYPPVACYIMARKVDTEGRVVVLTTHLERAELERDRIHAYGADPRIAHCRGSMSAIIEPASRGSVTAGQP